MQPISPKSQSIPLVSAAQVVEVENTPAPPIPASAEYKEQPPLSIALTPLPILPSPASLAENPLLQKGRDIEEQLEQAEPGAGVEFAFSVADLAIGTSETVSTIIEVGKDLESGIQGSRMGLSIVTFGLDMAVIAHKNRLLNQEITRLREQLTSPNAAQEKINERIKELLSDKNALTQQVAFGVTDAALTTAGAVAEKVVDLATLTPQAVDTLKVAGGITGVLGSILGLFLSSKAIHENRMLKQKITADIENVTQEIKDAQGLEKECLELRLKCLEKQLEENTVGTVKHSISLVGSILGASLAVKVLVVALGVTIGVGVGVALTAIGIGSGILAGAGLLIGIGYLIYKNRHAIQNKLQKAALALTSLKSSMTIKQIRGEGTASIEKIERIYKKRVQVFSKNTSKRELEYAQVSQNITKLEELLKNPNLKPKILQRYERRLSEEKRTQAEIGAEIKTLNDSLVKLKEKRVKEIKKESNTTEGRISLIHQYIHRRGQALNEAYVYGQHLGKFAGDVTLEKLKDFEKRLRKNGRSFQKEMQRLTVATAA